jgi:transposase
MYDSTKFNLSGDKSLSNNSQRICNWKEYNLSLEKRGELILNFGSNFHDSLFYTNDQKRGGKRKFSDNMFIYLLKLKVMLRLPWRGTIGLAKKLFLMAFGFPIPVPNYAHANRAAKKLNIKIKHLLKETKSGLDLAFDSTGVNVYTTSGYHQRRYGKDCLFRQKDQWKKIHISMDLNEQKILSMAFTNSNVNDCEAIKHLVKPIKFRVKSVRADGAYDTEAFHKIIHEWGAKAIIPPASTSKAQNELSRKSVHKEHLEQRDRIIKSIRKSRSFEAGLKRWKIKSNYHQRSKIESCMFRIKRIFGFNLQHKTDNGRLNEIITKINLLNEMSNLGMPAYES